ncbi:hypothetical protein UlMin_040403 [Ulmus minor]
MHIPCVVPTEVAVAYRNRKGFTSQNVMAMVDFEMKFTYIVTWWEGSARDARVMNVATNTPAFRFPHAPPGMLYLLVTNEFNKGTGNCNCKYVIILVYQTQKAKYSFYVSSKYYLVDAGYKNKAGFLAHFRGQNYHLHDHRRGDGDHRKEMFNYRHASLRNVIERTFGVWKNRFRILRGIPKYPLEKQRDLVIASPYLSLFYIFQFTN